MEKTAELVPKTEEVVDEKAKAKKKVKVTENLFNKLAGGEEDDA